jgi:signal transduction histidine kinase
LFARLNKVKSVPLGSFAVKFICRFVSMKWLSNRYIKLAVTLAAVFAILLQIIWLQQIFRTQELQMINDIERSVSEASIKSMYTNSISNKQGSLNYRNFFLSPEWLGFNKSFDAITDKYSPDLIGSQFFYSVKQDSTVITVRLSLSEHYPLTDQKKHILRVGASQIKKIDSKDIDHKYVEEMDKNVKSSLASNGISLNSYYLVYKYDKADKEQISSSLKEQTSTPRYTSKKYTYNLTYKNKYQLVVNSIFTEVLIKMRLYLFSAALMIILTCTGLYYILKLIRNKVLYEEAKKNFTSNMSHELKTPIAIMNAALDSITLFNMTADPQKLKEYINISKTELQRLKSMVEKVLDLEQVDRGEFLLSPELYDVQQSLEQVTASMVLNKRSREASIEFLPSKEPCFVYGDPVHLTNVFYNIIDNAIKYGGIDVHIIVSCKCSSDLVIITIEDNGTGIDALFHERIFERFFRIQQENLHDSNGSGLGLNYVKQVIKMHGGNIRLKSEPDKGSIFIINLPAYVEE